MEMRGGRWPSQQTRLIGTRGINSGNGLALLAHSGHRANALPAFAGKHRYHSISQRLQNEYIPHRDGRCSRSSGLGLLGYRSRLQ